MGLPVPIQPVGGPDAAGFAQALHRQLGVGGAYNDRLGKRRAEAVKMYLMKTGISSERLITETVGKVGSSPPPEDWDRRVDFELVP